MQPLLFLFQVSLIKDKMSKEGEELLLLHHVLHTVLIELTVLDHSLLLQHLSLPLVFGEGIANVRWLLFAPVALEIWK